MADTPSIHRRKRPPRPLDRARLDELALAYVARFASSEAKLAAYLKRKLRERGWDGDGDPPVAAMVERYATLGYVDDEAFARSKAGGLLRRGYGARRVDQALFSAGISAELRDGLKPDPAAQRGAALAMARKRRFGPFGTELPDPARREKQIAALLRAGHPLDSARELVDARTIEAAEDWAAAAEDEEKFP